MSKVNISPSEITLIDFTTLSLSIDVSSEGDREKPNRENDVQIQVAEAKASKEALKDGLRMFSLVVTVTSTPSDESAFYACKAKIGGLFLVEPESSLTDDEVREALSIRGVEEVYSIARTKIAEATSSGTFGMYMLPSIRVIRKDG